MKKRIAYIVIVVCLLIAFGATVTINWLYETFGHLSMDEIIFHLKVPMEGTNTDIIFTFFKECLWKVILPTIIISFALIYPMVKDIKFIKEIHTAERRRTTLTSICIAGLILIISISKIVETTDIKEYIENQTHDSSFISKEYVRPEISKLAKENTNFSDTDKLGGAYTLYGTTWTVGAMSAQTAGVPLKLSIDDNSMGEYSTFLNGAYSIGQVLENNGYTNYLLLGSDATFGGRRNLFKQHGNYEIWDFESAKEENKASEQIWWGFTDDQLFEYAKEKILNLSKQEKPFNFTFLTADTHFPDGFLCKDCPNKWDEQYKNVISCSSKRVGDFVKWLQKQDFYDNTTIVITGDHLTMQANFFEPEEGQQYDKKVVNVIINPAIEAENTKRVYSTMDLYPTTLGALGAKIEGNRLGLGTNLFSNEKTLIEKYGVEYVNNELKKVSRFYDNSILVK